MQSNFPELVPGDLRLVVDCFFMAFSWFMIAKPRKCLHHHLPNYWLRETHLQMHLVSEPSKLKKLVASCHNESKLLSSDQSDSSLQFPCSDIASGPRKSTYDTRPTLRFRTCIKGVVWR